MIEGKLITDPEIKINKKGVVSGKFKILMQNFYKVGNELKTTDIIITIKIANTLVEVSQKYLKSGYLVRVKGNLYYKETELFMDAGIIEFLSSK